MTSEFIFGSYLVDIVYKGKHGLYAHKCLNASKQRRVACLMSTGFIPPVYQRRGLGTSGTCVGA